MPRSSEQTRTKLIDAAARAFADEGVYAASLLDITRRAGQRNRAALHYHFGSRDGILCAVLERHIDFLARREAELLAAALERPDDDLRAVVEAVVRPAAELAESGWRGNCFLRILAELVEEDPASLSSDVQSLLARTGGYEVYAVLGDRMPAMPDELRTERFSLATSFVLRSVADRARARRRRRAGRRQLPYESFVENLVAMAAGALSAPLT